MVHGPVSYTHLSNLISNAFKYTPEGGKIVLSIDETTEKVTLVVEDNGIGIQKEFQEVIFDRFLQIENTEIFSTGDGIGLSFVKHLVELHDGTDVYKRQIHWFRIQPTSAICRGEKSSPTRSYSLSSKRD